jgi:hypothetical protein
MVFDVSNFLHHLRQIVTGGGHDSSGYPKSDSGYLKRAEGVNLGSIRRTLTDSTGGSASATLAGTVGVQQVSFDLDLAAGPMAGTSAADLVTDFALGCRFKLLALDFVTSVAGVGSSASQVAHLEIGATPVTNGTCTITEASTSAVGELTAGAAITGANIGAATDAISVLIAASGTAFTAGHGTLVVTYQNLDVADAFASLAAQFAGVADETYARVLKVEQGVDDIGTIEWAVPRDYDEATDSLYVRVLASQLTQSTDDDVQLDAKVYLKTAGSALGADIDPTKPATVLSTTEQWLTFDLSGNSLERDDLVYFNLITDGHNDTDGEEVLIHAIEFVYRSTIVSYDEEDASGNDLR